MLLAGPTASKCIPPPPAAVGTLLPLAGKKSKSKQSFPRKFELAEILYIFYKLKMRLLHWSNPITSKSEAFVLDFPSQPEHQHLIRLHCNFIAGITNYYIVSTMLLSKRLTGRTDISHSQFIFYLGQLIKLLGKKCAGPMEKDTDTCICKHAKHRCLNLTLVLGV